jgi:Protein of unknown function (DUF1153)
MNPPRKDEDAKWHDLLGIRVENLSAADKANICTGVREGKLERPEVLVAYGLTDEEFSKWEQMRKDHGRAAFVDKPRGVARGGRQGRGGAP